MSWLFGKSAAPANTGHTQKFINQTADLKSTFNRLQSRLSAADAEQDALRRQKADLEAKMAMQASTLIKQKQDLQARLSKLDVNAVGQRDAMQAKLKELTNKINVAVKSADSIRGNVDKFRSTFILKSNSVTPSMTPK